MVESTRRQYFVGGNWKCNGTLAFAKELIEGTLNQVEYDHERVRKVLKFYLILLLDVVVAPASVHLSTVKSLLVPHISVSA